MPGWLGPPWNFSVKKGPTPGIRIRLKTLSPLAPVARIVAGRSCDGKPISSMCGLIPGPAIWQCWGIVRTCLGLRTSILKAETNIAAGCPGDTGGCALSPGADQRLGAGFRGPRDVKIARYRCTT